MRLRVGSHVTFSVGSDAAAQLLVRGTELVQGPSPVQPAHRAPDLHAVQVRVVVYLQTLTQVFCFGSAGRRETVGEGGDAVERTKRRKSVVC